MAEPIMWTERGKKFQRPAYEWNEDGQRVQKVDDLGRPLYERVPQTGRVGVVRQVDDIASTRPMREPRAIQYLRDDGHEIHAPIRSAAAALNGDHGTDMSLTSYVRAKAKHFGWLLVHCCPVDVVLRGERNRLQMYSPEVREAIERREACPPASVGLDKPPCKHYRAERDARRRRRLAEHEQQVASAKSNEARTLDVLTQMVQRMPGAAPAADPGSEFAPQQKSQPPKGNK